MRPRKQAFSGWNIEKGTRAATASRSTSPRGWGTNCSVTQEKNNHGHQQLLSASRDDGVSISVSLSNLDDERKAYEQPHTSRMSAKV